MKVTRFIVVTHTRPFYGPLDFFQDCPSEPVSGFIGTGDIECQWHQRGHMQICTSPQTDHAYTPPVSFLQAGCPSCCQTNSIKALKAMTVVTVGEYLRSWESNTISFWQYCSDGHRTSLLYVLMCICVC